VSFLGAIKLVATCDDAVRNTVAGMALLYRNMSGTTSMEYLKNCEILLNHQVKSLPSYSSTS